MADTRCLEQSTKIYHLEHMLGSLLQLSLPHTNWKISHQKHKQEAQLMLTTGSTRLAVSRGQQTWYHSTCYI